MQKVFKWIGIGLAGIIGLVLLGVLGLLVYGQVTFKRTLNRPVYEVRADTSPAGVAQGEYLVMKLMACGDCHSAEDAPGKLSGMFTEVNEPPIVFTFAAPNLTPDLETGLGNWTDAEIARAIREGVDKNGVELVIMPAFNYHVMSDADVAAIIGYLRTLEPVKTEIPPIKANVIVKSMYALGMMGPHSLGESIETAQSAPESGSYEYGQYVTRLAGCRDCHGEDFTGGTNAMLGMPAPDLTASSELASWGLDGFITTLRTGVTPTRRPLSEQMPWKAYSQMTDEDLAAIYNYLQSLSAQQSKNVTEVD